uniref:CSON015361 protein n=1 Tax=Culicoides sonorensis TaxID=179676 RepID=A0A336MD52_CULSO
MPILSLTIDSLPCELMLNIFEHLSVTDRNIASLTSTGWYEIINHLNYLVNDNILVFGDGTTIEANQAPFSTFVKRYKKVRCIKLMKQVQLSNTGCDILWQSFGTTLTEIEFVHTEYLTNEVLTGILKWLKKLKVLKLYAPLFRRWKLFQKNRFLINDSNRDDLRETLNSITHLTLCDAKINDLHLMNLLENLPNLTSFDATSLYFRNDDDFGELTTNSLLQWLENTGSEKLKELHLKNVDDTLLSALSEIPDLQLKSCSLQLDSVNVQNFYNFIDNQTVLERLSLDLSKCNRPENLLMYCENVDCLTELKLGIASTMTSIAALQKFTNLRKLSTYLSPTSLPSDGSEFHVKPGQNPKLKELEIISGIPFIPGSLKSFTRMLTNYKQINSLKISGIILSDKEIQSIFRVMESLRELNISNCEKITDKGISGFSGKANFVQYSLQNLKGLRHLTLSNCHQLTDKSLKDNFHLPELQYLSLTNAHQITEAGLDALTVKLPVLENFVLTSKTFFDKIWIESFRSKCRRLKSLAINVSLLDNFAAGQMINCMENNGNFCFPFDR